jgi:transposase-like protein
MFLNGDALLCPYCGSTETTRETDRDRESVYGCRACGRTFLAP